MADIEPYKQIQKTNIKEHNDLVAKINEIIDVVNQTNLETITPKIDKLEQDVSGINATDSLQWNDIENIKLDIGTINPKIAKLEQDVTAIKDIDSSQSNDIKSIKAKNTEQDNTLKTHATEITGIAKSLVSNVALINGTTAGNMKVRIERGDAPSIDSNDYNIQKPASVELVQGSAPAMVKAQITLSDGTVLISDDFMFTTEAIGQDVYISSFVFKNGNVAGTISADIGLSNGSTLTANNFAIPTDPNVTSAISDIQGKVSTVENEVSGLKTTVNGHTTSINGLDSEVSDLQTRVTAVESDTSGLDALKTTVDGHTASINALGTDVTDLQIGKADVNNGNQSIVAGSISANNLTKGGVEVATINDIPTSSGEVWEEINLSNIPTNWSIGDRIKVEPRIYKPSVPSTATSWTSDISGITYRATSYRAPLIEFELDSKTAPATTFVPFHMEYNNVMLNISFIRCTLEPSKYTTNSTMFYLGAVTFNGSGLTETSTGVTSSNIRNYIVKMWRLKKG